MGFMSFTVNYVLGFGFFDDDGGGVCSDGGFSGGGCCVFYGWWLWVVILIWFLFCFYFLFGFVGMDLAVVAIDAGGFFFFPMGLIFGWILVMVAMEVGFSCCGGG